VGGAKGDAKVDYSKPMQERWLKAELHAHCNLDPMDHTLCSYSAETLIAEAARLGYEVLAITCHDTDVWSPELSDFAARLGITLIPGMEVTVGRGWHTLAYNFRTGAKNIDTFEKLRALSRQDTLVIAPHPHFPSPRCLGRELGKNLSVFDAVEISGFHARGLDFNRRARAVASAHAKPLVGNSDAHFLWQLGRTYTWIYSQHGVAPILNAVKQGRVRVESTPLSYAEVVRWWTTAIWKRITSLRNVPAGQDPRLIPDSAAESSSTQIAG